MGTSLIEHKLWLIEQGKFPADLESGLGHRLFEADGLRADQLNRVPSGGKRLVGTEGNPIVLDYADLTRCNFEDWIFEHVRFNCAELNEASFARSSFRDCDFQSASLKRAVFQCAIISRCRFNKADLSDVDFSGMPLDCCDLDSAALSGTRFTRAVLTRCSFDQCSADGFSYYRFEEATISGCKGGFIAKLESMITQSASGEARRLWLLLLSISVVSALFAGWSALEHVPAVPGWMGLILNGQADLEFPILGVTILAIQFWFLFAFSKYKRFLRFAPCVTTTDMRREDALHQWDLAAAALPSYGESLQSMGLGERFVSTFVCHYLPSLAIVLFNGVELLRYCGREWPTVLMFVSIISAALPFAFEVAASRSYFKYQKLPLPGENGNPAQTRVSSIRVWWGITWAWIQSQQIRTLGGWLVLVGFLFTAVGLISVFGPKDYVKWVLSNRISGGSLNKLVSGHACLCSEPAMDVLEKKGFLNPKKRVWRYSVLTGATLSSRGCDRLLLRMNAFGADLRGARIDADDLTKITNWNNALIDQELVSFLGLPKDHNKQVDDAMWGSEHDLRNKDLSCQTLYLQDQSQPYKFDGASVTGATLVIPDAKYENKLRSELASAKPGPVPGIEAEVSGAITLIQIGQGCGSALTRQRSAPQSSDLTINGRSPE